MAGGATGTGTVTLLAPVTSTDRTLTLPDVTDTVAGIAATQTLTNKTLTTPVISSLSSAAATALTLQSAGTTAVTIDTSQNVLVGTTSSFSSCFVGVSFDGNAKNGLVLRTSTNATGAGFAQFVDNNNAACGIISRVGTTSAVVYTATSDRRLKENIVDAPSAIAHINAVKVRSFNWIAGGHQIKYGVIAQEFVEVEPDAVVQGDDAETVEKTWSVDTAALVPAMIKAIQELKVIVDAQGAEIATLKGAAA
jgi:hypothetical protein